LEEFCVPFCTCVSFDSPLHLWICCVEVPWDRLCRFQIADYPRTTVSSVLCRPGFAASQSEFSSSSESSSELDLGGAKSPFSSFTSVLTLLHVPCMLVPLATKNDLVHRNHPQLCLYDQEVI
jgi:hypothetical protein